MGSAKVVDDVVPGWIECWRLWRHCLCRHGWYPLFLAPLVTCACLLDLFSSTGCDFIRMDIGFTPANDVWSDSHAQLGLFSFDSHLTDKNKWKRAFNDGCQPYNENFESVFIANDQSWHVSRIMAYISGISSLIALATAWLLTITPLPASFFWPGVLLPAVILSMLSGAAKFIFYDTLICSEPLWFADESSTPVVAKSCSIGESSVFGVASVAAYFFCTILICFRSPQKRALDESWGRTGVEGPGSMATHNTHNTVTDDIICNDPERGNEDAIGMSRIASDSQMVMKNNNAIAQTSEHGHERNPSDMSWSTDSNKAHTPYNERTRNLGVLAPVETPPKEKRTDSFVRRPIVVTVDNNGHAASRSSRSLSNSDGSTTQSSGKSPRSRSTPGGPLPPRHNNGKSASKQNPPTNNYDSGSIGSRISKLSFIDSQTHGSSASDDLSALGMQSYSVGSSAKSAPSVVAIPRRTPNRHTFSSASPGSSNSTGKKLRYASKRSTREDRNDIFSNDQSCHARMEGSKRDLGEHLPPLDEMSTTRSLEDHGDLINKCVRDLQMSFDVIGTESGWGTM